ncbi:MAG: hypothetical protein AMQ22_00489 [Candidatus Methanofastidiosum methylothiophilum]|uniref:Uncharacterized protein n=1 Tax=Candidatus Methanofastidiosum methylothiophilum TaxID=1705564 RepID=A0A150J744_9EURY|nr:MAG: hypothetical protein AMQ22_00489 [Candidatus Methanofastidiosum methylthiophilus]
MLGYSRIKEKIINFYRIKNKIKTKIRRKALVEPAIDKTIRGVNNFYATLLIINYNLR